MGVGGRGWWKREGRGRGRGEGVAETPTRARIGRRPNGVLRDAWRRDAERQGYHLAPPPCTPSRCSPSSVTRSTRVPRRRASLLREDGAARPVRLQEFRQRGWRTRGMQDNHRTATLREDHPKCRAFARGSCGERIEYVFIYVIFESFFFFFFFSFSPPFEISRSWILFYSFRDYLGWSSVISWFRNTV